MVAEQNEAAVASKTKIVHCCGYDSIPSDLGAQAVADHIRATFDRYAPPLLAPPALGRYTVPVPDAFPLHSSLQWCMAGSCLGRVKVFCDSLS